MLQNSDNKNPKFFAATFGRRNWVSSHLFVFPSSTIPPPLLQASIQGPQGWDLLLSWILERVKRPRRTGGQEARRTGGQEEELPLVVVHPASPHLLHPGIVPYSYRFLGQMDLGRKGYSGSAESRSK